MKIIKFSLLSLRKAVSHSKRIRKGFRASMSSVLGEMCASCLNALFCWIWSTIGDVRKCTDEEHITYSGGSKIKDLAQCG